MILLHIPILEYMPKWILFFSPILIIGLTPIIIVLINHHEASKKT